MSRSEAAATRQSIRWTIDPASFGLWAKAISDIEGRSEAGPPQGMTKEAWIEFLVAERIAPYYHHACSGHGNLSKDGALAKSLKHMHLHFLAANEIYLNESFDLLRMFNDSGIVPVLFKGIQLQCEVYPVPELRPSSDLDLLIRDEEKFAKVESLLEKLGFEKHYYRSERYARFVLKEIVFTPPAGRRVMVELHHGLRFGKWDRRRESDEPLVKEENLHRIRTERAECLGLNDPSNYLLLCHHAFQSHMNLRSLLWVNDLRMMRKRLGNLGKETERLATDSLSTESCEFAERLLEDLAGDSAATSGYLVGASSPEMMAGSKVVAEFRNLAGPAKKAAWLWWWLFPDYSYLKRKYGPGRNPFYICFRHCAGLVKGIVRLGRTDD